jgi:hypothetical protein
MHEALTFWTSFEKEFAMEIAKLGVGTIIRLHTFICKKF